MEQHGQLSDIARPASISRVFKHRREYPALPKGYDWETQKKLYCPRDLLVESRPGQVNLKSKFGYVFCHRGLYERASGIVDNSAAAIANGTSQGFFLHEVDAFVLGKLGMGFLAHDKIPRRVTSKEEAWESYSFHEILKTALVTRKVEARRVETGTQTPDFASSYLPTDEKVSGVLDTLWKERLGPVGRSLQIDLRDDDFAKAIPYYSFHVSKLSFQHKNRPGAHHTLVWSLFKTTILKGYNSYFKSFGHLHDVVKEKSIEAYGRNYFEIRHLHVLPPLVMVFFPGPLIELAKETAPPGDPSADRRSYEHLRRTFRNQVLSFVGVGKDPYDFILEIVHSGLGLGYDVETGKATNPLTGESLLDKDVIFESRVDRAMIDVSLELREKYPRLLFSSCTRLPDVITPKEKLKASFRTSRLVPWEDGEKGLSTKLRAMHGGLYPQSHLVVADDPAAEIAARTWIDQKSGLDRSDLLRKPYNQWLAGAKQDVVAAMTGLNDQDFLPNKTWDSVPADDTGAVDALRHSGNNRPDDPVDPEAQIRWWFRGLVSANDASGSDDVDRYTGQKQTEDNEREEEPADGDESTTLCHDVQLAADESAWKDHQRSRSNSDASEEPVITLTAAGRRFIFASAAEAKRAVASSAAYKAAERGNEEVLTKLLSTGANVDASTGPYGTALAVACAKGHDGIVRPLLDAMADVNRRGPFGSPLELASRHGHGDIVKMLVEVLKTHNAYRDTPARLSTGTALHEASRNGHDAVVQFLLDSGADVDFAGGQYHTALQAACSGGNMNIISMLLSRHADVNGHGGLYGTALRAACVHAHHDAARLLLNNGAVVDFPLGDFEPGIVSLLVKAGADVNRPAAPHPSPSPSSSPTKEKRWARIKPFTMGWEKKKRELKRMNAPPLVRPRQRRNCGCILCFIDQAIQPAIPRHRPDRVRAHDPVSYTLRQIRNQSASP